MGGRYFLVTSLVLLALTLVGFGDNLVTDVHQPSNSDPKFIVHGLACLGWMIVLATQAALVRAGRPALHRRLGLLSTGIAALVTLSTVYVFWLLWTSWAEMSPEVRGNRLLLPSYSIAVLLGYRARRRPDRHKRLMLVGTFFMMGPVLARTYDALVVPFMAGWPEPRIDAAFVPYMLVTWTALFVSLIAHDRRASGRLHPVTAWGFLWFGIVWAIVFLT